MAGSRSKRSERRFVIGFLLPAVILYGWFVVMPLLQSFQLSFYHWTGLSRNRSFVGFDNLAKLAQDSTFVKSFTNAVLLLVFGGAVIIALSLLVAHATVQEGRMAKTVRALVLVPQILSVVAIAVLWRFIYNPSMGLLTSGLNAAGLSSWVHTWLGESHTALPSVGVTFIWQMTGFYVLLFAAGIRGIPQEVYEAATLDGAMGMYRFRRITWPMLWSIKRVAIVHLTITVMNIFALVVIMTNGGEPDRATEMPLNYLYETAISNSDYGYGSAQATVNFIAVMLISCIIFVLLRKNPETSR